MSFPPEISSTCDRRAFGLSRVTINGGLGLFLEPGGRPLGRRLELEEVAAAPPELVAGAGSGSSFISGESFE